MGIENNIVKLFCQHELGTALLINENHAITVFHCVKSAYEDSSVKITLRVVINKKWKNVEALLVKRSDVTYDEDSFVYMQLKEPVENICKVRFMNCTLAPFQEVHMFGYGKNRSDATWVQLKSIGASEAVEGKVCDLQFETIDTKDDSFSGFSGSPLWDKEHSNIVGLIAREDDVNQVPIFIEGISVKSQMDFFRKFGIDVESLEIVERNLGGKAGIVQTMDIKITGVSDSVCQLYNALLNETVSLHRKGYRIEAQNKLKEHIQQQKNDESVSCEVKAQFLLQQALWILDDNHNVSGADKSYKKALEYDRSLDGRAFLALHAFYLGDKNARDLVKPIDSLKLLNIFMQICVNQNDGASAIEAYALYKDIYLSDDGTWYLLAVAYLLQRDFLNAEAFINKAIEKNAGVPDYYLVRALIKYWRIVPEEAFVASDNIYPQLYFNGIYFFEEDVRESLNETVADFRIAYNRADTTGDQKKKELLLTCWIDVLSIDNILFLQCQEPMELLRKENADNVTIMMIDVLCGKVLRDEKFEKRLRVLINKRNDTIGYILVLVEYFVSIQEKSRAKSLLFEYKKIFEKSSNMAYWYEHISNLEENEDKRKVLAADVRKDTSLSDHYRKRILCMLESNSPYHLQRLEELYGDTESTVDIMNIIWYTQKNRKWEKTIEYAEILAEKHHNPYGYIYLLKAYIKMKKYEEAYSCVQKVERLNIPELNKQIQMDKIAVLQLIGEYDQAIAVGEDLFKTEQTEAFAHMLANLYIKKGRKLDAIQVLQIAEKNAPLSSEGYQRLSGYYRMVDPQKSSEYAEKFVEASKRAPEALSWAVSNAANIGMSDKIGIYWKEIMKNHSDSKIFKTVNVEELMEMTKSQNVLHQECESKFSHAEIPIHVVLDVIGNALMSGVFYGNWNDTTRFSMICFGGNYLDMQKAAIVDKIILDYTSCLLLNELNMLELLAANLLAIYLPSNINPVILEEQDKLCSGQSDLLNHKKKVLDYCTDTLQLRYVKQVIPDDLSEMKFTERADAIYACTAKENEALWIDLDRNNDYEISVNEVYAALSGMGYMYEYDRSKISPEKVDALKGRGQRLLIGILALEDLYDQGALDDLCELYDVALFDQDKSLFETQWIEQSKRYEIAQKLELLKDTLEKLNQEQKLKWCIDADQENSEGLYYDLLASAMMTAIQFGIPYCVDDRFIQSYGQINNVPVYSTMDIIKIMHHKGWINDRRYMNIYKEFINKKIGFVVSDAQFVYEGLLLSSIECGVLVESKQLLALRTYVEQSFNLLDQYSGTYKAGINLAERKGYSVLHLMSIRAVIEKIWLSDIELEKKQIYSNWVILQYSRMGEALSLEDNADLTKDVLVVFPIVQLIMQGMLFTSDVKIIPRYSEWLYSLFSYYLENNVVLLNEVTIYLLHEIHSILQNVQKYNEGIQFVFEQSLAHGIHCVPDFLCEKILDDEEIFTVYQKFFIEVVPLNTDFAIPCDIFYKWCNEVFCISENQELVRWYDQTECKISWKYIMPLWPRLKIGWNEKGKSLSHIWYCEPGRRLYHDNVSVRIKEVRKFYEYFGCGIDMDVIEQISTESYQDTADMLNAKTIISDSFVEEQIRLVIKEKWMYDMSAAKFFLPGKTDYLKKYYDYESSFICNDWAVLSFIPIEFTGEYECVKSLNPVQRLHYVSWILSGNKSNAKDYNSMFEFMKGGCQYKYGQIYIALLKIIFMAMEEVEDYAKQPIQNRIIWTYIWVGKLYDEVVTQIQSEEISLDEYQQTLCDSTKEFGLRQKYSTNLKNYDVIDPFQMNIMRLCLLGTVELCFKFGGDISSEIIKDIVNGIETNLKIWLQSSDALVEYLVSHENAKNEWGTLFAADYHKELNKIQGVIYDNGSNECIPSKNYILELQRILEQDSLLPVDKTIIIIECLNEPDDETIVLLKAILEKFYLDKNIIIEMEEYGISEIILSRLSEEYNNHFRKATVVKLKDELIHDLNNWRKVFGKLIYVVGDNLELCADFWEMVAEELKVPIETECISWLTRLQLVLPIELGQRIYSAKVKMINQKFEI